MDERIFLDAAPPDFGIEKGLPCANGRPPKRFMKSRTPH
jgi:hypothetical protein